MKKKPFPTVISGQLATRQCDFLLQELVFRYGIGFAGYDVFPAGQRDSIWNYSRKHDACLGPRHWKFL